MTQSETKQLYYEICTCDLRDEQIAAEAAEVVKFCQAQGLEQVRLEMFDGIARIAVEEIPDAILRGISKDRLEKWSGMFGTVDITIFAGSVEIEFCHHDGIHLRADEETYFPLFEERWRSLDYPVNRRLGETWHYARANGLITEQLNTVYSTQNERA